MDVEEEWEKEEECGTLKVRPRKGKSGNPDAVAVAVAVAVEEEEENVVVGEPESCVYLDRDKGLWKCRYCIWTYRMESPAIDHVHNHERYSNVVMNAKTSSQQGSYFGLQSKGIESTDEIIGTHFSSVSMFTDEKKQGNDEADFGTKNFENQNGLPFVGNLSSPKHTEAESQSSSLLTISEGQREDRPVKFESVKDRSGAKENGSLVDSSNIVVEMDVERVLEEQDTHDLYCPNCHSCITKRVILRKRKRILRDHQVEAKREKIQPVLQPDLEASPDAAVANATSNETGPDVFRCLSCFSFFIPTASGFKLFSIFGRNGEGESLPSPQQQQEQGDSLQNPQQQQEPTKNLNCISSIFELFMGKRTENVAVNDTIESGKEEIVQPLLSSQHLDEEDAAGDTWKDKQSSLVLLMPGSLLLQEKQIGNGEKQGGKVKQNNAASHIDAGNSTPQNLKINGGNGVKDQKTKPLEDDKNILISSRSEALLHGEVHVDVGENLVEAPKKNDAGSETMQNGERNKLNLLSPSPNSGKIWPDGTNDIISINLNGHLLEKLCASDGKKIDGPVPKPLEDEKNYLISSKPGVLVTGERKIGIGEILEDMPKNNVAVADMICVGGTNKPVLLEPSQSYGKSSAVEAPELLRETIINMAQQRVVEVKTREWDILKSIVYGGLIESITSLGVVSSAAGSDASTLNIVALGVANLITGLFVIVHSLRQLKNDRHSSIDQEGGELDRYEATLGQRGNFRLHATVAVLSYILFGLLAPVIYGFSFRKSDNKEYKLIAVAAASLLCIILFATGKAHVRRAPKNYFKTVFYYVCLGVMTSGLSYVVGEQLKRLLEKLGWFDSSASASVSSDLAFQSGWASY